jgi:hypothetical protein
MQKVKGLADSIALAEEQLKRDTSRFRRKRKRPARTRVAGVEDRAGQV